MVLGLLSFIALTLLEIELSLRIYGWLYSVVSLWETV